MADPSLSSIGNDGTKFYLYTNVDAPQHKLVSVDIAVPPEKRKFVDVIPEDKNAHLEDVRPIGGDNFVVVYKRNVCIQRIPVNSRLTCLLEYRSKMRFTSTTPKGSVFPGLPRTLWAPHLSQGGGLNLGSSLLCPDSQHQV